MSAGVREKLALLQKGVMSNAFGNVAANTTSVITIEPIIGTDWIIGLRIDFAGVSTPGVVTYELTNGQAIEAGYAENTSRECLVPDNRNIRLTIANNQATPVYYNVLYICVRQQVYECDVKGTL